ncbi:MAG: Lamin Tail Domain [Candidatus Woesearchaeota archaeon]|nr:Lamin Tail Domain [Candidatus Woesearchaeota archaeon]
MNLNLFKKSLVFITLLFCFAFLVFANPDLKIIEVMYNPPGDDFSSEFFELCNLANFSIDLTNYKIIGVSLNLTNISIKPKKCLIFAHSKNDFFNIYNLSLNYSNQTFEFKGYLKNSNFSLMLLNENKTVVDTFTYDGSLANGNGLSLNFCNNSIFEEEPSPFYFDFESCILNETTNKTFFDETLNETLVNQTLEQNNTNLSNTTQTYPYENCSNTTNQPISITNSSTINIHIDSIDGNFVSYQIYSKCSYIYWIEDLFQNIIKPKLVSNTTTKKQFTSKYDKAFFIKAKELCQNQTSSKLVLLNTSFDEDFDVEFHKYKSNKVKITLLADYLKFNSSILCYLNSNKEIFSFYSDSIKPLTDSSLEFQFYIPEQFLNSGNNKIECIIQTSKDSRTFVKTFDYQKPELKQSCTAKTLNKLAQSETFKINSFYTLDTYLKSKNHFFMSVERPSSSPKQVYLEIFELKNSSLLNLSETKIKTDFYIPLNKTNTTLLAVIKHNKNILTYKTLNISLQLKKIPSKESKSETKTLKLENVSRNEPLNTFLQLNNTVFNLKLNETNESTNFSENNFSQDEITSFFSYDTNSSNEFKTKLKETFFYLFTTIIILLILLTFYFVSKKKKS